ncbi:MAG: arginine deiminase [Xanthomonadales bacterium]|nr:arginine deiminase [Gammaproteobacteria bacterium]MBT8055038.1 arginine deiminase [Gammaproteobacteria bacterium]NND57035.1 arginine deiminase [Xanthomonadales bacterium]
MRETQINLDSEIGALNAVMVHRPGREIENMTPATAAEVLYDDILNLQLATREHDQLTGVLRRVADVLEFEDLLRDTLADKHMKGLLVDELVTLYGCEELAQELKEMDDAELAPQLFQGTPMRKDSLEKYLSPLRHAIPPLPNAFFTRDAVMAVNQSVIIGSMAFKARFAETLLLKVIFKYHTKIRSDGFYFDGTASASEKITIEGGDLLVLREDLIMIGYSERTTARGIDTLMRAIAEKGGVENFIVVEIPKSRATIHLDMIFTMVDRDRCVVFSPLISGSHKCRAFHVHYEQRRVKRIVEYPGVLEALKTQGLDLKPIPCGGDNELRQEREQWASGANFFALAPGHILGYEHNQATAEELAKNNFRIVTADQVIKEEASLTPGQATLVTMHGSELSRGGGGCRCMTMPLSRKPVNW